MNYGLIFLGAGMISSRAQGAAIRRYGAAHNLGLGKNISYRDISDIAFLKPGDGLIIFAWNYVATDRANMNKFISYLLQNHIRIYSTTSPHCIDSHADFTQFQNAFNLYEDIRFSLASSRSLNGAARRIANGNAPGRHRGSKNVRHILDGRESIIRSMYSGGSSIYAIAKKMQVSPPTIKRFLITQS